jgi:peroxiredoxin
MRAPDFTLKPQENKIVNLHDFEGSGSGCTVEGPQFPGQSGQIQRELIWP